MIHINSTLSLNVWNEDTITPNEHLHVPNLTLFLHQRLISMLSDSQANGSTGSLTQAMFTLQVSVLNSHFLCVVVHNLIWMQPPSDSGVNSPEVKTHVQRMTSHKHAAFMEVNIDAAHVGARVSTLKMSKTSLSLHWLAMWRVSSFSVSSIVYVWYCLLRHLIVTSVSFRWRKDFRLTYISDLGPNMKVAWVWFLKRNLIRSVQIVIKKRKIRYGSQMGKKSRIWATFAQTFTQIFIWLESVSQRGWFDKR